MSERATMRTCEVDGCDAPHCSRGMCKVHYSRWHRSIQPKVQPHHGWSYDPLYPTWQGMVARCTHVQNKNYPRYGGRGITVFPAWLATPGPFIEWMRENLGERPEGYSLDRIDNDGNYEPGNLRWADKRAQAGNRRKGASRWGTPEDRAARKIAALASKAGLAVTISA